MNKVRVHIWVSGKVQGVFFRSQTLEKACQLGVNGWVKNLANGQVEAVLEGEKEKVEQLINWIEKGPGLAKVAQIKMKREEYQAEFDRFEIRY